MTKILILQGGFNEEHKVSLNTSKEIAKAFKQLKIKFKTLTVNPITFENDILEYSNDYICFNALHGPFGEDGKIQKILKRNNFIRRVGGGLACDFTLLFPLDPWRQIA